MQLVISNINLSISSKKSVFTQALGRKNYRPRSTQYGLSYTKWTTIYLFW